MKRHKETICSNRSLLIAMNVTPTLVHVVMVQRHIVIPVKDVLLIWGMGCCYGDVGTELMLSVAQTW